MDTEVIQKIQQILYYIEEYEKGNEEYYDAIVEIVKAIKGYYRTAKKNYKRTKVILTISKITTSAIYPKLQDEKIYQGIMDNCYHDLEYYLESSKRLDEYANICTKTNEFPDLQAAYLLTIKLSLLLDNIMSYIKEIRLIEKSSVGFFVYCPSDNLENNAENNRHEVDLLVRVLELRGEEDVPRN